VTERNLFYHPYASFTNMQLPLLKVAAMYFDKLVIFDRADSCGATIGADHHARDAVAQGKDADILQTVTSAKILAKFAGPGLCVPHGHPLRGLSTRLARPQENRKGEWSTLSLESMNSTVTNQVPRGG
jgi:hypothetical protein